jgi:hypothetical protein
VIDDVALDAPVEALLRRLAAQHEIFVIVVPDLDPTGEEPEILHEVIGNAEIPAFVRNDPELAAQLGDADAARREERARLFTGLGISHEVIGSTDDAIPAIFRLLGRTRHAIRG